MYGMRLRRVTWALVIASGILVAQESQFGVGIPGANHSKPEVAQGSSAGIQFESMPVMFEGKPITDQHMVSYDSRTNELLIVPSTNTPGALQPFGSSIGENSVEEVGFGVVNPESELASFTYAALFASRSGSYAWYLNYNWSNFEERLNTLGNTGFRIENIDTYGHAIFNYAGTWTADGKGWSWYLNQSNSATFSSVLNGWPVGFPRYRPIDFAIHPYLNSTLYYGAVAVQDNFGFGWTYNSEQTPLGNWITGQYSSNRRLIDLEIYRDPSTGTVKYAAISVDAGYAQAYVINYDWTSFLAAHTNQMNQGRRLIAYDVYNSGGTIYYAGVWSGDGVGSGYVLNYSNQTTFTSNVNSQISLGRLPIMIDVYDSDDLSGLTEDDQTHTATTFELGQNYPNPFNPSTTISFTIPTEDFVTLKVYNILGVEVATLVAEELAAGSYTYAWQATDQNGTGLASGIYLYRLSAEQGMTLTGKMMLMK